MEASETAAGAILTDWHVHIGPFDGGLMFEPEDVAARLVELGVQRWLYMSTAFPCNPPNYMAWFRECIDRMESAAPGRGMPALWMNADMLENPEPYHDPRCVAIKIHEGHAVLPPHLRERAFALARERGLALIIHTGLDSPCRCGDYDALCSRYPDVQVTLAHGRPHNEAIDMLRRHPNVSVDSAYMPNEQVQALAGQGFRERIRFGTDFPMDTYFYPQDDAMERYRGYLAAGAGIF